MGLGPTFTGRLRREHFIVLVNEVIVFPVGVAGRELVESRTLFNGNS